MTIIICLLHFFDFIMKLVLSEYTLITYMHILSCVCIWWVACLKPLVFWGMFWCYIKATIVSNLQHGIWRCNVFHLLVRKSTNRSLDHYLNPWKFICFPTKNFIFMFVGQSLTKCGLLKLKQFISGSGVRWK